MHSASFSKSRTSLGRNRASPPRISSDEYPILTASCSTCFQSSTLSSVFLSADRGYRLQPSHLLFIHASVGQNEQLRLHSLVTSAIIVLRPAVSAPATSSWVESSTGISGLSDPRIGASESRKCLSTALASRWLSLQRYFSMSPREALTGSPLPSMTSSKTLKGGDFRTTSDSDNATYEVPALSRKRAISSTKNSDPFDSAIEQHFFDFIKERETPRHLKSPHLHFLRALGGTIHELAPLVHRQKPSRIAVTNEMCPGEGAIASR